MTVEEIHQLIDVRIRQKTLNGSIEKGDVADALDAIVDALAGLNQKIEPLIIGTITGTIE